MSIDALKALETDITKPRRLFLDDPDGEQLFDQNGNPAYIDLLGSNSKEFTASNDAEMRKRARGRKAMNKLTDPAQQRSTENKNFAAVTKGWHLVDYRSKLPIDFNCTPANALALYQNAAISWIRDQVASFVYDDANRDEDPTEDTAAPLATTSTLTSGETQVASPQTEMPTTSMPS